MQIGPVPLDGHHVCLAAKSRQALARIGATEEGLFRHHLLLPGGRLRHRVSCRLTHDEWPRAKAHREGLLAAYPAPAAAALNPRQNFRDVYG